MGPGSCVRSQLGNLPCRQRSSSTYCTSDSRAEQWAVGTKHAADQLLAQCRVHRYERYSHAGHTDQTRQRSVGRPSYGERRAVTGCCVPKFHVVWVWRYISQEIRVGDCFDSSSRTRVTLLVEPDNPSSLWPCLYSRKPHFDHMYG